MNAFPAAVTITGCVFTIMLVCQNVYHSNDMLVQPVSGNRMELHGSFENGIRASKQIQENHYLRYAVYFSSFAAVCVQNLLALAPWSSE